MTDRLGPLACPAGAWDRVEGRLGVMVPTRDQTGAPRAVFETAVATVYAEDDGTVVLRFREGCRMTAENTPEVVSAHVAAAAGAKRPTLSDVRGIRAASREARELA